MDVRFINPFIQAVTHVFTMAVGERVLVSKPFIEDENGLPTGVAVIMDLSGDVTGTVAFQFSPTSAVKVAQKLAEAELTVGDPMVADALGELLNMVAGQARANLTDLRASVSVPRLVAGEPVRAAGDRPVLVIPCDSALGRFRLEVTMRRRARAKAGAPAAGVVEAKPAAGTTAADGAEAKTAA